MRRAARQLAGAAGLGAALAALALPAVGGAASPAAPSIAPGEPPPGGPATVTTGTITVGRGANGVTLGMRRATVIERLGRPAYENRNGYMQFVRDGGPGIFDVYRAGGARASRVRMISIAATGDRFVLDDGTAIFARGALRRVARRWGRRLRARQDESAETYYEIVTRWRGRAVSTQFSVARRSLDARVLQVFVLWR